MNSKPKATETKEYVPKSAQAQLNPATNTSS